MLGGIRIGFADVQGLDGKTSISCWSNTGTIIFNGSAHLCCGASIDNTGVLEIGEDFKVNGNTKIICKKHIAFGNGCLLSWGSIFMDTDFHTILYENRKLNPDGEIFIGDHCWIGCNCIFLKGACLKDNSVVAAGSTVTKAICKNNVLVINNTIKKENISWEY